MRFRHLYETEATGTFVGVKLTTESNARLTGWLAQNLIIDPEAPDEIHITLILDKTSKFVHVPINYDPPISLDHRTFRIEAFGPENDTLVLRFDCEFLEHRHAQLKAKYDIQWDFPDYSPHITLTDEVQEIATELEPPDFELEISGEYVEEFSNAPD